MINDKAEIKPMVS